MESTEPATIREMRFSQEQDGYRRSDVEGFLERVADAVEKTRDELTSVRSGLEMASLIPDASRVLDAAQRVARDVVEDARNNAAAVFENALGALRSTEAALSACDHVLVGIANLRTDVIAERQRLEDTVQVVNRQVLALAEVMSQSSSSTVSPPLDMALVIDFPDQVDQHTMNGPDVVGVATSGSWNRFTALDERFETIFPGLGQVLEVFEGTKLPMSREQITAKLDDAALLITEPSFRGAPWLSSLTETIWSSARNSSWDEQYLPLIRVLFDVGFIGFRPAHASETIFVDDSPDYATSPDNFSEELEFVVHPTFRSELGIESERPFVENVS